MAEFKISRLRYRWRGTWETSTSYIKDDIVEYAGSSWYCVRAHTSDNFLDEQEFLDTPSATSFSPAWIKMTDGKKFMGQWTAATAYIVGDLVAAGGTIYLCTVDHLASAQFVTDIANWAVYAIGSNFRQDWTQNTRYRVGDIVKYNGITYQCILEHTSGTNNQGIIVGDNIDRTETDDSSAETWLVLFDTQNFVGDYTVNTKYKKNDLIKFGANIWRCITEHTSGPLLININYSYFTLEIEGIQYRATWSNALQYLEGDIVRKGAYLYVATTDNLASEPGNTETFPAGNPDWNVIVKGIDFKGDWSSATDYKSGDIVRRGGYLYVALTDILPDGSSLDYLDAGNWEIISPGRNFRSNWVSATVYNKGDLVYFRGSVYEANIAHTASNVNFPGDNGNGFSYWDLLVEGDHRAALTTQGDILSYNLSRSLVDDGSTLDRVRVPIGSEDQLLYVENDQGELNYKVWGNTARIFYVRTNGLDDNTDPNRGINYFKPYRTVRYACEQADDGYAGTTTIKISTGLYQEILPIIVPARTAIVGEELRSVTIQANDPIEALSGDVTYTIASLNRIGTILNNLILGVTISKTTGNTETQSTLYTATASEVTTIDNLLTVIKNYINWAVLDIGTEPAVVGTNTANTSSNITSAINNLEENKDFLAAEAVAYISLNYPAYNFDSELCKRDIKRYIDGIKYDLRYTGTYKSILAARYYSNAVNGSQLEDMFYVRDASGVRNLTVKGLAGELAPVEQYELYQRPTGGSYVSLDPGWGPADTRTWISTRSPYIQNVTTFGYAAVGQKIDGALHNGGNKSIVSNDFTQVISDGIGAWVLNGGLAELVSVFTYYAQIGMFAEDGGVIRATNGNSSYGKYGAVADGNDPTETPKNATVTTRENEATVLSAFAGEVNDYLLVLEFGNAGQNYTSANYTVVGSGVSASLIQEEIRDNAVFEAQVRTNGANYILSGNNAQTGGSLTITLATNDESTAAEILGTRIVLTSGEGTGQYGYVQAYNAGTKVCTVYRESDDQPGWDHVVPGTPVASLLTTGTRYLFEPRITFSDPGFTATTVTSPTAFSCGGLVYAKTVETYSGISTDLGAALFNIVLTNRTYTVTLADGGSSYSVGNELTIQGSDVGGINGDNDIVITVTSLSGSAISTFTYEGYGATGKFVAVPLGGTDALYSKNGVDWSTSILPNAGNYKAIAAGNNKIVTIINGSDNAAYSVNGTSWTATTMPASKNWIDVVYGEGIFVAVNEQDDSGAISTNGTTWTTTTLPDVGDSTKNNWAGIAYGKGKFVAVANSSNAVAVGTYNSGTGIITWSGAVIEVQDSSPKNWSSIAYGNGRFVVISTTGDVAYSFDGLIWYSTVAGMPNYTATSSVSSVAPGLYYEIMSLGTTDFTSIGAVSNTVGVIFIATQPGTIAGGTGTARQYFPQEFYWKKVNYGQGLFFAVCQSSSQTATTYSATSQDGIVWTPRTLSSSESWSCIAFGSLDTTSGDSSLVNNSPTWIAAASNGTINLSKIRTGARAFGRARVETNEISSISIIEPGSGYTDPASITITDPNNTTEAIILCRMGDGVLAQPTFLNRGNGYKTSTTTVTVTGDGFSDVQPVGRFITLSGLEVIPGPGSQLYIEGQPGYFTVVVPGIDTAATNGTYRSTFRISPSLSLTNNITHGMSVEIRERYSQVRITGHDFLDVGVGNFEDTNYPALYVDYIFTRIPANEVGELNGGRVFYTSTDQDGNFRAGELFAVEQATGIVTISADFFNLQGLSELALGGVTVGGSGTIIREFSTDPLFTANSNNIVPTQKAIVSYLQSRLNIGGEDLLVPSFTAGTVRVGPNLIDNTAGLTNDITVLANFSGPNTHIQGSWLAQNMFFRSFKDDGQ